MKVKSLFICVLALSILHPLVNTARSAQWQVVSPVTFTRGKGEPITEILNFSAMGGTATFHLTNGGLESTSTEKVSSSTIILNGVLLCGPSDFNQNVNSIEKEITLLDGINKLEVSLMGKPDGQVTIQILGEATEITPEISVIQTANALKVGNIDVALEGFLPDEKRENILRSVDDTDRNQLAFEIENAVLVEETENMRFYRYSWTDETGENFIEFTMAKDETGKWIITSW